ncbi:hypothetical protein TNIN_448111 [Trichonephila inaurata madagascariensis]|uniref:Uncharacterized protein n=1 Tax=Trichonephila inaurata madagascariensis TaxID=2747483 RepID=A0A8X6XBZ1_9ARAC|nr:hypothetical protein TNIN_448111 [Trichonephila inaurata madagascariensis]
MPFKGFDELIFTDSRHNISEWHGCKKMKTMLLLVSRSPFRVASPGIGQYFNYEYTNCFTINARWANWSAEPLSASMFRPRSGRSSELSIMLNLERKKYSPMNPVVRARMTIHAADTIPNPQYDGVSLQPGLTYNYGIRESIVHVLPYPYQTNCKNYTMLREIRTKSKQTQEGTCADVDMFNRTLSAEDK